MGRNRSKQPKNLESLSAQAGMLGRHLGHDVLGRGHNCFQPLLSLLGLVHMSGRIGGAVSTRLLRFYHRLLQGRQVLRALLASLTLHMHSYIPFHLRPLNTADASPPSGQKTKVQDG